MLSQLSDMKDRLSSRMESLLLNLPRAEQQDQMAECVRVLEASDFETSSPDRSSPERFARDLLQNGPSATRLAELAVRQKFNPASAESPEDLILRLLPSDGHLE